MPKLRFHHSPYPLTKPLIDWHGLGQGATLSWQGKNWQDCESFLKQELSPICRRLSSSLKKFLKHYMQENRHPVRLKLSFHQKAPAKYPIAMSQGWLGHCAQAPLLLKAPRQNAVELLPHELCYRVFKKNSHLLSKALGPHVFISIDPRPHSEVCYTLNGLILDTH